MERKKLEKEQERIANLIKKLVLYHIEPDRELLAWERWIEIRSDEVKRLGQSLERPPADLTMNLLEKIREDKERKVALEEAKLYKKPDIRGTLWERPERLHQTCYWEPVYEVQRTRAEKGNPRIIEHIRVPDYIQATEKGVCGTPKRKPCPKIDAEYVKYRDKRENELKDKIQKIDPFRPDMRELFIKGSKPAPPVIQPPPNPEIIIDESQALEIIDSVYAVIINKTLICKDIPHQDLSHILKIKEKEWHEACTSWSYYFKVAVGKAGRSKVYLKNLGTVTLRFCWKKIKKTIPFIPDVFNNQVFFFNKNEDVLPPGQSKEIFFTFMSDKPGIYSESWELSFCNICFFDNLADKLLINLYADSVENVEKIKRKIDVLKTRINRKAIVIFIRKMVEDIVKKALVIEPLLYPYKKLFLEAEIFLMKNPVCFYHQTEVMKMRNLYSEMLPNISVAGLPAEWDLSIGKWREAMMAKDYDDRMKYYDLLKQSHSDLLKPWNEGESLSKLKWRTTKWLLGQLADKIDLEYNHIIDICVHRKQSGQGDVPTLPKSFHRFMSMEVESTVARNMAQNLFYIHVYEHVSATIELISGVLSSLDLNKWLDFDFCRR